MFRWLKKYLPRRLYGRAALIIVLPVVVLQLVVSVVFIRRHLEDVTTQMTLTVVREMKMIEQVAEQAGSWEAARAGTGPFLAVFQMELAQPAPADVPGADRFRWYDYSARVVRDIIRNNFGKTLAVVFDGNISVRVYLQTEQGPAEIIFNRRRVTAAAPHQLILTMLLFGVVMTIIAFVYMRNQLRPITRLAAAAEAFGRGRVVPYGPSGAVEVRAAGRAFLDMRARIERQIEQRTLMLSGVSHDLRTPLTRMKLGLAMIGEEDAEPLLRDVDEMQHLLDAFLDFAKGASEGEPEAVDVAELVHQVAGDAQRAGKPVTLRKIDGGGSVMLRKVAIRRALENLIGNAVQYGSRAEISVTLGERSLRIRVEDDGPGIPEEHHGEALKPFTRLDPARNQNFGGGVGLGLAIVNDVARAHGGVLRLGRSERLGGLQADIVIAR